MDVKKRLLISKILKGSAYTALYSNFPLLANIPLHPEVDDAIRRSAEYTMVYASPYSSGDQYYCPHMHYELKKNIQEMSGGRIYVDIKDNGILGTGHELMAMVARGTLSAALVSVSNLSPAAPELDILNIPFWSSKEQDYLNLVTSLTWKELIINKIRSQGKLDILFHYLPGSRTVSSTMMYGKVIKRPDDIKDIIFRVPRSKVLRTFYKLEGASPVSVDWNNVASMAKKGRIDVMDPSVVGLYNGPNGLRHHVGVISKIQSVYDGWVAVISQQWYKKLPLDLRLTLKDASEKTFREHLNKAGQTANACTQKFKSMGTKIYIPTNEEKDEWVKRCGPDNSEWAAVKRSILGDEKNFQKLIEATKINNGYNFGVIPAEAISPTGFNNK
jgi:TRAP-type C4-dicarboxylate transport system substrate-binding protein